MGFRMEPEPTSYSFSACRERCRSLSCHSTAEGAGAAGGRPRKTFCTKSVEQRLTLSPGETCTVHGKEGCVDMEDYSIGTLARKSGVPVRVIRFYTAQDLLPPARVAESGYRYYTDSGLARLRRIIGLRQMGISLRAIRDLLSGQLTPADVLEAGRTAAAAQQDRVERVTFLLEKAQEGWTVGLPAFWRLVDSLAELGSPCESPEAMAQWWHDELDAAVPADVVAGITQSLVGPPASRGLTPVAAAVWSAVWRGSASGAQIDITHLPGTPWEAGLTTDETWSTWLQRLSFASQALQHQGASHPKDPGYQVALRNWVRCFGPLTVSTVRRCLKALEATNNRGGGRPDGESAARHLHAALACLEGALLC